MFHSRKVLVELRRFLQPAAFCERLGQPSLLQGMQGSWCSLKPWPGTTLTKRLAQLTREALLRETVNDQASGQSRASCGWPLRERPLAGIPVPGLGLLNGGTLFPLSSLQFC